MRGKGEKRVFLLLSPPNFAIRMDKLNYILKSIIFFILSSCNVHPFYHCEGYVKDINGVPIAYVRVRVPIDSTKKISARTFTDTNGYYRIQIPSHLKKMRIGFTHSCYTPMTNVIGPSCVKDTIITTSDLHKSNHRVKIPDVVLKLHARPTSVVIRGRLLDWETGKPVAGASYVSLKNGLIFAISNRLGYYDFIWSGNDTLRLDFVKKGYELMKHDTTLVVEKGSIVFLPNLKMKKIKN